jgi:hypothetical protein
MVASAGPSIRAADAAATSSYLHARYTLEHGRGAALSSTRAAVDKFVAAASHGCPGAMRRAPRSRAFGALNGEALDDVVVIMERTNRDLVASFRHSVFNVRWRDSRLTREVRRLANREIASASLTPPALCRDIETWARGDREVPRATTRFLHEVSSATMVGRTPQLREDLGGALRNCRRVAAPGHGVICSGASPSASGVSGRGVLRLLAKYEASDEKQLARGLRQLESSVEASEKGLYASAAPRLSQSLGLDPAVLNSYVPSASLAGGR